MLVAGRREIVISNANRRENQRGAADHCFGLENFQRVQHIGCEAIEASEHEPIDVVEDEALGRLALQHIELMTKNENFSVQRSARPEQPGHKAPNQPTDIAHNIEYHPIRRRSSAIWVCGRDSKIPNGYELEAS